MYIPKQFTNSDKEELLRFITENSFGILVNQGENSIMAAHIPMYLSKNLMGEDILQGHVSKGNEMWKNFNHKKDVLAIFSGPHAYISSSWYDHENVPTWNYIAVHVYGSIRVIEGDELIDSLKKLVDKYEIGNKNPVSVEKMTSDFLQKEIKGIVGFEIRIKDIQGAYKLSQNRDKKNYDSVISNLNQSSDKRSVDLANEMLKRKK